MKYHPDQNPDDPDAWKAALTPDTKLLFAETIGNPGGNILDIEKVAELVKLPPDHVMGAMVAIGKGVKDSWPKPGQLPLEEVLIEDSFS